MIHTNIWIRIVMNGATKAVFMIPRETLVRCLRGHVEQHLQYHHHIEMPRKQQLLELLTDGNLEEAESKTLVMDNMQLLQLEDIVKSRVLVFKLTMQPSGTTSESKDDFDAKGSITVKCLGIHGMITIPSKSFNMDDSIQSIKAHVCERLIGAPSVDRVMLFHRQTTADEPFETSALIGKTLRDHTSSAVATCYFDLIMEPSLNGLMWNLANQETDPAPLVAYTQFLHDLPQQRNAGIQDGLPNIFIFFNKSA